MRNFSVELAGNVEVGMWRRAECDRAGRYKRRKTELGRQLWDEGWERYEYWMDDDWFPLECWCCNGPGPGDHTFEEMDLEGVTLVLVHGVDGLDAACTTSVHGD